MTKIKDIFIDKRKMKCDVNTEKRNMIVDYETIDYAFYDL